MFAGIIIVPLAISLRTSSAEIFSFCATNAISSVTKPNRAKCICDMFVSPVRAASAFRFTTHSARPVGTLYPFPFAVLPFPFT